MTSTLVKLWESAVARYSVWIILSWFWAVATGNQVQSTDHCFNNHFTNLANSTHMQFTKEVIATEYAILGDFKSLHCCAKGYRSIEWMKDGKAYPWSSDISSLILYPEASNQTIYTRQVQVADVGNYTCVVRNDTHKITHHISLNVQGTLPDLPLATFHPHDQVAELNSPARFYCEAFVGKVGLPDAKSDISWFQVFKDGLEEEVDGIQQQVLRENGQTIGSYLTIPQVQAHNYGRYLCRIQFGSVAHRLEMYAALFGKPIEAEPSAKLLGIYHTVAAVLSAIVAAILVLCVWYLIWPRFSRQKGKNQCQAGLAAEQDFSSPRRV